jgi:uncharacterized SAM-binding protein YcdF (DUF218 family)
MEPTQQTQIAASGWSRPLVRVAKDMTFDAGLICALIAAGLWAGRKRQWARTLGWAGFALLVLFSSPLAVNAIRAPILGWSTDIAEKGAGCVSHPGPVVILGGGASSDGLPALETMERVAAAATWIQANPVPVAVLSGGPASLDRKAEPGTAPVTEAAAMERFARFLTGPGADHTRFIQENRSLNTHDNAIFTRELLGPGKRIVLVTSQVHMPRAAATFEKAGFEVCAVIAPEAPPSWGIITEAGWLNFGTARKMVTTLNEWLGILGYRLLGWA